MTKRKFISRRSVNKLLAFGATSYLLHPLANIAQSSVMNHRIIPSTNERIPVIGLGTWQTFDVGRTKEERDPLREVLKILIQYGGSVIDSSPMYGRSEMVVGELISELNLRDSIFEATKVWTSGKDQGISQIDRSFELLQTDHIDLLQVHNLLDWKIHLRTLKDLKEKNRIKYLGITHYHTGGYAEMEKIMKSESIDFIQINYNLAAREAGDRILPLAREKGIAVIINQPYQGGSLFRKTRNRTLPEWTQEFNAQSWGQFFLKFILGHQAVTCVIPGTSKPKHMKDNAQAGFGEVPTQKHRNMMVDLIKSI